MLNTLYNEAMENHNGAVPQERRGTPQSLYHGTTPEAAASILMNGFDLNAPKRHDCGDFGNGIYLTQSRTRARHMGGPAILEVEVDLRYFAYIPNPYFLQGGKHIGPINQVEEMFYIEAFDCAGEMATIHGDKLVRPEGVVMLRTREKVCQDIQELFLRNGFKGIHTEYSGRETVVFSTSVIKSIVWKRS